MDVPTFLRGKVRDLRVFESSRDIHRRIDLRCKSMVEVDWKQGTKIDEEGRNAVGNPGKRCLTG